MDSVESKVFSVFASQLSLSDDVNRAEMKYNEFPGWDSVVHMTLIAELEDVFDCMMDMQDILDMSSFEKAVEIMTKYNG